MEAITIDTSQTPYHWEGDTRSNPGPTFPLYQDINFDLATTGESCSCMSQLHVPACIYMYIHVLVRASLSDITAFALFLRWFYFAGTVTGYTVTLTRDTDPPIVLTFTEDPFDISFSTVNKPPPL